MCSRISINFVILFDKVHYCVYVYWLNGLFFFPYFLYGLVRDDLSLNFIIVLDIANIVSVYGWTFLIYFFYPSMKANFGM